MNIDALLENSLIFLAAAVVCVLVAQRLKLGPVLGYLLAGVLIGPWGVGLVHDVEETLSISKFGVVLLLFVIGLELNPKKLWQMRHPILGLGGAQVLLSLSVITLIACALGLDWRSGLVIGMGLALSSTAMALKMLQERNLSGSVSGESTLSVLLFQDIAVIPMLACLPLLADGGLSLEHGLWQLLGIIALLMGGHYLLQPLLRWVVLSGVRELFTVAALLVVVSIALMMQALDLSMALGSFVAGVLLADSEYRHELESAIAPFKGILLGLFFMAIGMTVDMRLLITYPVEIVLCVLALLALKFGLMYGLARSFGLRRVPSSIQAILLSQGGEFAFILFSAAQLNGLLSAEQTLFLFVVVSLSMVTTPLFIQLANNRFAHVVNRQTEPLGDEISPEQQLPAGTAKKPQVIISGFGRFGQVVGRLLYANKIPITILEKQASQVTLLRHYGYKVYYGDSTQLDLLRAAGAEHAQAMVLCGTSIAEMIQTVRLCQQHFPKLVILARAKDRVEAHKLLKEQVYYSRETFLSALDLGRETLVKLGMHPYQAKRAERHFRRLDTQMLEALLFPDDGDEDSISRAIQARKELEVIFAQELAMDQRLHNPSQLKGE